MFDSDAIAELDAHAAAEAIAATQRELRAGEWRELALAAHWAVLHDARTLPQRTGPVLPGTERAKQLGGDGTPAVAEFACAELGLLMGIGYLAADRLMRDAIDLQHRHPLMWAALAAGRGRVWKARKVASVVHAAGLSLEQAHFVDAATTPYVDTLPWGTFNELVEAKVIEADPEAAEERRVAAEMARFVSTGQSNEYGLKTLIARAAAGDVIFFVAMCDRIAQLLLLEGDGDPVDVRRSKAVGILAQPARALALLQRHAVPDPADDAPSPDDPDLLLGSPEHAEHAEPAGPAATTEQPDSPSHAPQPVDPDKMRPKAVLYVRISEESLRAGVGVAYCENDGVGPITVGQVRDFLGHCHVTVRPVLDLRGQVPVDAYEVPAAMREALRLARSGSVFPWSRSRSRSVDWDHTVPYRPLEEGGPPGQTRIGNLAPLTRFAHRVKTHGRGWRHRQLTPGVYLWRTPHGYWYRVDADGTHPLGRDPDPAQLQVPTSMAEVTANSASPLERELARIIAAA